MQVLADMFSFLKVHSCANETELSFLLLLQKSAFFFFVNAVFYGNRG